MAADRVKVGISACFFHADPTRPIFTGKTLQYVEQSVAAAVAGVHIAPAKSRSKSARCTGRGLVWWQMSALAKAGVDRAAIPRMVEIAVADICHQTNPRPVQAADFSRLFAEAM